MSGNDLPVFEEGKSTPPAELFDKAFEGQEGLTSCSHVHPQFDVYHPGGHPENDELPSKNSHEF